MIWTAGRRGGSVSCRTHPRASTSRTKSPARRIWTPTGAGSRRRTTVTSGHRPWWWPAGRPTASVTGCGSLRGDGRGSMMRPGVMHRFTTAAGCWVPGPRHLRPVYAPALVAWVGGPGGGVAVGVGANVGWFPLAPREVYVPGYHVSPNYVRNVNITNTTIVNNTYITNVYQNNVTNIHYVNNTAGAVTAVPQNVFTSGQRVGGHLGRLPAAALAGTAVTAAPPAIVPSRQSVLGANAGRSVARPPAALASRPVVARTPPPRAPVPFDRQVAAIRQNGGRPLARADLARLQPATPVAPVRVIAGGAAGVRAGAPAHGPDGARPGNSATATRPGSSAPAPSAGGQAPSFADRERVLQNN